jgi:hypothetical protein
MVPNVLHVHFFQIKLIKIKSICCKVSFVWLLIQEQNNSKTFTFMLLVRRKTGRSRKSSKNIMFFLFHNKIFLTSAMNFPFTYSSTAHFNLFSSDLKLSNGKKRMPIWWINLYYLYLNGCILRLQWTVSQRLKNFEYEESRLPNGLGKPDSDTRTSFHVGIIKLAELNLSPRLF